MVAEGAGGAGYTSQDGGHGGNLIGQTNGTTIAGKGGNQNSGGSGGYTSGVNHGAGGGGSSYISGYAGVNSVNSSGTHTAQTNSTANGTNNKYFIAGEMQQGINEGNGKARITYEGASKPARINTKLNGVRYIKDCATGNGNDNHVLWAEIQAIKDGVNLAKSVGSIDTTGDLYVEALSNMPYSRSINGIINIHSLTSNNPTSPTERCLTVDLGEEYNLDEVMILHLASELYPAYQPFYNNITSVAGTNKTYREVIHTVDKAEDSTGKRVGAYGNYYTMTNLIKNGDFSNGLEGWYTGINIESKYGIAKWITGASWQAFGQEESIIANRSDIYYVQVKLKNDNFNETANNSDVLRFGGGINQYGVSAAIAPSIGPTGNVFKTMSYMRSYSTLPNDNTTIYPSFYALIANKEIYIDYILLINLTEAFGHGNEPSQTWLDENIDYFEGTKRIYLPY